MQTEVQAVCNPLGIAILCVYVCVCSLGRAISFGISSLESNTGDQL